MNKLFAVLVVCVLLVASFAFFVIPANENTVDADCYFGISFCGDTAEEAKLLIDRVKGYTNLFVLQSGPVSENETATDEICSYAVDAGLDIIVYFGNLTPWVLERIEREEGKDVLWRLSWIATAKEKYGDSFLGVYYYDESGGIWLDKIDEWLDELDSLNITNPFLEPTYDSIAEMYTAFLHHDGGYQELKNNNITVFSSDYALYWFDYPLGYDVVFAQIGWNHTMEQDIALLRGAATLQNKNWGTMITWKYDQEPYLDTAENIYNQMQQSYEAGAEYIIIFNFPTYPEDNQYGVMTDQHFDAMENFWKNVIQNPNVVHGSTEAEAALVLPQNYGWGMRNPEDTIWALWGPDEKSEQIWTISRQLLEHYVTALDIIYDDPEYPIPEGLYEKVYYWNQTLTSIP
jgi:hypothetical protein